MGTVILEADVPAWMNVFRDRAKAMGFPCSESHEDRPRRLPWDEISLSKDGTRAEHYDWCLSLKDKDDPRPHDCRISIVGYEALRVER